MARRRRSERSRGRKKSKAASKNKLRATKEEAAPLNDEDEEEKLDDPPAPAETAPAAEVRCSTTSAAETRARTPVDVEQPAVVVDAAAPAEIAAADEAEAPFDEDEWEEKVKDLSREEALEGATEDVRTATSVAAKTLCIPFKQPDMPAGTPCFVSGKPAKCWVLWGRSY